MKFNQLVSILVTIVMIHVVGVVPARADVVPNPVAWDGLLIHRDHKGDAVARLDNADTAGLRDASVNTMTRLASSMNTGGIHADGQGLHAVTANPNPDYSYTDDSGFDIPADTSEMIRLFFSTVGNRPYDDVQDHAQADNQLHNAGHLQKFQPMSDFFVEETPNMSNKHYSSSHISGGNNPVFSNTVSNPYVSVTPPHSSGVDEKVASSPRECCRTSDVFLSIGFIRLNRWEFSGLVLLILFGLWGARS